MKLGRAWAFPKVPWKWNGSPTFRQGHFSAISNRVSKKNLFALNWLKLYSYGRLHILTGNCVLFCAFSSLFYICSLKKKYIFGTRSEWANDIWRRNLEVDKKSWNTIFPCLEGNFMEIHHLWKEFGFRFRFFCFTFSRRFFGHFRFFSGTASTKPAGSTWVCLKMVSTPTPNGFHDQTIPITNG